MTSHFNELIGQAWARHSTHTNEVAQELNDWVAHVDNSEKLQKFVALAVHVFGEHLRDWPSGLAILKSLKAFNRDCEQAVTRAQSFFAIGQQASRQSELLSQHDTSDRVRILSLLTQLYAADLDSHQSSQCLWQASNEAATLNQSDGAHRALAVAANNTACTIEELQNPSISQIELMLGAAEIAKQEWSIAGGWPEIAAADYRRSQSLAKALRFAESLRAAEECLELCQKHALGPYDLFFAFEALAKAHAHLGNLSGLRFCVEQAKIAFGQQDPDSQDSCRGSLLKLEDLKS
jgi:hypothetical protein